MMTLSPAEQAAIADANLFLCFVTPAWLSDAHAQAQATYAAQCGLPFRVVLWPGVRLPEDAFAGVQEMEVVRTTDLGQVADEVKRWLGEG